MKSFRVALMLVLASLMPIGLVGCYGKAEAPAVNNPNIPPGKKKIGDQEADPTGKGVVPAAPAD